MLTKEWACGGLLCDLKTVFTMPVSLVNSYANCSLFHTGLVVKKHSETEIFPKMESTSIVHKYKTKIISAVQPKYDPH